MRPANRPFRSILTLLVPLAVGAVGGCGDGVTDPAAQHLDPQTVAPAQESAGADGLESLAADVVVLCHRANGGPGFVRIIVAAAAEAAHRAHGDGAPGEVTPSDPTSVFGDDCSLLARRSFLYISNTAGGTVSVLDRYTHAVVASLAVGSYAEGIALTPDGAQLWAVAAGPDVVTVFETATNTPVATIHVGADPIELAFTPDGAFAYVLNRTGGTVSVISTATYGIVATIPVPPQPRDIAITPDGAAAYIAHGTAPGVASKISTATNTVVALFPVESGPLAIAITPDGSKAYVSSVSYGTITVINTLTDVVDAVIPGVGSVLEDILFAPGGDIAYLASFTGRKLLIFSTTTNTVVGQIDLGPSSQPFKMAFANSGGLLYVTNYLSNTVLLVDTATGTVVETIGGFSTAWGVAILEP